MTDIVDELTEDKVCACYADGSSAETAVSHTCLTCRAAAEIVSLRGKLDGAKIALQAAQSFQCAAEKQASGHNDPMECNHPFCGCDPKANDILSSVQEAGFGELAVEREACAKVAEDYEGDGVNGTFMREGGDASLTRREIAAAIRARRAS